jgi:hypothetical protein
MSAARGAGAFNVLPVPLVAIDCGTLHMRRYFGRQVTDEADIVFTRPATRAEVEAVVHQFLTDPSSALDAKVDLAHFDDQPRPA